MKLDSLVASACILVLATCSLAVDPPPGGAKDDVYAPPARELDPRLEPGRVTESEPPPLPSVVVLPLPPEHVIASGAKQVPISPTHYAAARWMIDNGLAYLRQTSDARGGWLPAADAKPTGEEIQTMSPVTAAISALGVKAFVQAGVRPEDDPVVDEALRAIMRSRRADGAFEGGALSNYVTSAVVMALAPLDELKYHDELEDAKTWLVSAQWDQSEGVDARRDWFGGTGYGNRGRPDLSNTQTTLDALYESGMSPDEPAFQRALAFVSRAQNLEATNPQPWTGNDGGFVYTPANGGESMASEAAGEGRHGELIPEGHPRSLRSYGSMTYAGFKSMLYAGLSADDVRVRAAYDWIRRHFTFDENPGMGPQGLYYYYHTMSRALRVAQQPVIESVDGTRHNWREELIDALAARQQPGGHWVNESDRWLEGNPELATIYALLALEEALKP